MPADQASDSKETVPKPPMAASPAARAAPPEGDGAAATATAPRPAASPAAASPAAARPRSIKRRVIIGVIAVVALAVGHYYFVPVVQKMLSTVSTDDAYVNGHVTFVAPRVPGQVTKVYVDDNDRVRKGSLLVQLDKEPYRIQVALKKAAYETAVAQLAATIDQVRGTIGQARSIRYKLQHAIESVDNQIALLRADIAALATRKATLTRSKADLDRAIELAKTPGAIAPQDVDQRREAYQVAQAQVNQALETVYQIRVGLGLPAKPEKGDDLSQVPADLDQNYSTVRQALAELLQSAAVLGIYPSSYTLSPKQILEEFYKRDPTGNIDRIFAHVLNDVPTIKLAQSKRDEAKAEWDQAELNLQYCDIVAEIDGVITRRNVNPGNNVQIGEGLMALRSLTDIWVDANFKETQLYDLRIGQPAELEVDMYGEHKVFKGQVSGFTFGTGSTLALLPAQNATGNFIKVVQRLPVRIDLVDYDPDKDPLFVGLSVVPYVYFKEHTTGKKLRDVMTDLKIINPDQLRSVPPPSDPPPQKPSKATRAAPQRPAP